MTTVMQKGILEPLVVGPGEDRAPHPIRLQGHELLVKAMGHDTGGSMAIAVLRAEPMSGPPVHIHTREDEWFYVLAGELTFQVADRRFTAGPGTSVFAPRNVPHTWQNCTNENAEALGMVSPAGIEDFFLAMAQQAVAPEAAAELMNQFGIQVVGPPIAR